MSTKAYLAVAVFRNENGTLSNPELWVGIAAETLDELYFEWEKALREYISCDVPIASHALEVNPDGTTSIIPWRKVKQLYDNSRFLEAVAKET